MVVGRITFGTGMIALMISMLFSLREIQISVDALNVQLSDLECEEKRFLPITEEEPQSPHLRG